MLPWRIDDFSSSDDDDHATNRQLASDNAAALLAPFARSTGASDRSAPTPPTYSAPTSATPAPIPIPAPAPNDASDADALTRALDRAVPDAAAIALSHRLTAELARLHAHPAASAPAHVRRTTATYGTATPPLIRTASSTAALPLAASADSARMRRGTSTWSSQVLLANNSSGASTPASAAAVDSPLPVRRRAGAHFAVEEDEGVADDLAMLLPTAPLLPAPPPPPPPGVSVATNDRSRQVKAYLEDRYAAVALSLAPLDPGDPRPAPGYNPLRALRRRRRASGTQPASARHHHRKNVSVSTVTASLLSSESEMGGDVLPLSGSGTAPVPPPLPPQPVFPFGRKKRFCEWEVDNLELARDVAEMRAPPPPPPPLAPPELPPRESAVSTPDSARRDRRGSSSIELLSAGGSSHSGPASGSAGAAAAPPDAPVRPTIDTGLAAPPIEPTKDSGGPSGAKGLVASLLRASPSQIKLHRPTTADKRTSLLVPSASQDRALPSPASPILGALTSPTDPPTAPLLSPTRSDQQPLIVPDGQTLAKRVSFFGLASNSVPLLDTGEDDEWTPVTPAQVRAWRAKLQAASLVPPRCATAVRDAQRRSASLASSISVATVSAQTMAEVAKRMAVQAAERRALDAFPGVNEPRDAVGPVPPGETAARLQQSAQALDEVEAHLQTLRARQVAAVEADAEAYAGAMEDLQWELSSKYLQTIKRLDDGAHGRFHAHRDEALELFYTLLAYLLALSTRGSGQSCSAIRGVRKVASVIASAARWVMRRRATRRAVGTTLSPSSSRWGVRSGINGRGTGARVRGIAQP
ncbi:hypothetical protein AMAG_03438 [Allomyces macrogynus ATCC 38327]|uniref:Uncharacterized protein n=1 Tax=Allomyces macrogynus (strain ATCC 38327) TaxID=578462 RepID=A0A0L0S9M6_ALLM3|nr:hypothetical protein AMAG_03438 [Allomyces macrogynus ATCC 38327]|eukprot:KNE59095.1 hypothetical protein AMAG_03438 [Allomyces macrogynus ATCC 38327]